MNLICSRNNGNGKTTLEKGGRDPPDVTLDKIAEDLLAFIKGFEHLNKPEENIKKKYDIKQEHEHNCWPEDDIKRAWGKSKRMGINSAERKDWSAVILLQMLKRRFVCGECKLQAAQENRHATTDEQGCETTPSLKGNSKDRSSQSNAELETVEATDGDEQLSGRKRTTSSPNYSVQPCAAGDEQLSGAGLETSKCKPTEDSGLASESPLSTSSTDEASTAGLCGKNCYAYQNNNETKDPGLVNENEDTLVNSCEQQKNVDYYELRVADEHDKENVRWEDLRSTVMNQACGKSQRMKGNPEDRSSQSNAELETVGAAAGGVKKRSGAYHTTNSVQPYSVSQGQTGTHFPGRSQVTGNLPGAADGQDRPGVALHNEGIHGPTYIRIPFSHLSSNRPLLEVPEQPVPEQGIHYTFINGSPSVLIDDYLWRYIYYVMSFDDETNNAEWVYEILNRQTLVVNLTNEGGFGAPYQRGHLAAAANHRWCQEAQTHANLISNIVPQHWTLNLGPWKRAEDRCRDLTNEYGIRNVHVYSGPIYQCMYPQRIQDKAVPNHFFKVIIVENENGTVREPECYLMPNDDVRPYQTLRYYWRTITEIEQVSGLTFIERTNVRGNDETVMMTMVGQDRNEVQRTAEIQVKIRF